MRGPNLKSTTRARSLRHEPTVAESKLWACLRNRQLGGVKFSRQVSIGPFFADFCCREAKLVIEIDGVTHETLSFSLSMVGLDPTNQFFKHLKC